MKTRIVIWSSLVGIVALAVFLWVSLMNVTGIAPMIAMPVVVTMNGEELSPHKIKSLDYAFREAKTTFEGISQNELKAAKPLQKWFLVDAPFSILKTSLGTTTKPEYRSLTLRLALVDGQIFTMSIPVLSDTELNTPIQIDVSGSQGRP